MTLDATRIVTTATIGFVIPQVDDYESCDEISTCKPMQRIIHLSNHFQSLQNNYMDGTPIYEYISSLIEYDVATFMEDWYHSKISHFKTKADYDLVKSRMKCDCADNTSSQCMFFSRYRRDRARERFDITKTTDYDHKNIILRDQLDSIHSFIFHSVLLLSKQNMHTNVTSYNADTDACEIDHIKDMPSTLSECDFTQILYIIHKSETFKNLDKLVEHKQDIITFFKERKLNGTSLINMKRKPFANQITKYLGVSKLRSQCASLYSNIVGFNLENIDKNNDKIKITEEKKTMMHDIVSNYPKSMNEGNMEQILYILND
eukprot:189254_1